MTENPTALVDDLGWTVGVLFRAYVTASEEALRDLPGGPRGYQVLTAACGATVRNQGAIAADLGMDRTVLTYLLDELERHDLIVRTPDPTDRRSRLITATATGKAAWRTRRAAVERAESHLLGPLSAPDAELLRRLLRTVACGARQRDPMTDLCAAAEAVRDQDARS